MDETDVESINISDMKCFEDRNFNDEIISTSESGSGRIDEFLFTKNFESTE